LEQCGTRRDIPDLPNGAPWSVLYQAAQRDGVRVMLSGDGGDEWLSGSLWHQADLLRTLRLTSLIIDCRATGWSFDNLILPLIPRPLKRFVRGCVPEALPPWIDPAFAARTGLRDRWQRRPAIRPSTCAQRELLGVLDSGWYAMQHDITNRLEAEAGIEGRSPFYDRRLIEFMLAIPEEQRRRGRIRKYILRRATAGILPDAVRIRRTKAEFSHLYHHAIEREHPETRLSSLRLADDGYLSMPAVRELYADSRRGTADPHALWMIFAIDAWYRTLFT
jgi:asparagine synthase (glutamine-hydrolysing)